MKEKIINKMLFMSEMPEAPTLQSSKIWFANGYTGYFAPTALKTEVATEAVTEVALAKDSNVAPTEWGSMGVLVCLKSLFLSQSKKRKKGLRRFAG